MWDKVCLHVQKDHGYAVGEEWLGVGFLITGFLGAFYSGQGLRGQGQGQGFRGQGQGLGRGQGGTVDFCFGGEQHV